LERSDEQLVGDGHDRPHRAVGRKQLYSSYSVSTSPLTKSE